MGDEFQARLRSKLPGDAGGLFYSIWTDVVHLQIKWSEYRELYGVSQERIDLLNSEAPSFFGNLHRILLDDVILAACRLTDPPRTGKYENASLGGLLEELQADAQGTGLPSTIDQWKQSLEALQGATTPLRALRDKVIAHADRDKRRKAELIPLPSRQAIEEVLNGIRELTRAIHRTYVGGDVLFEQSIPAPGGTGSLVASLTRGREHRTCLKEERRRRYGIGGGRER